MQEVNMEELDEVTKKELELAFAEVEKRLEPENPMSCMFEFATPIGVTEFNTYQKLITETANAVKNIFKEDDNCNKSPYGISTPDDLDKRKEFAEIKDLIVEYASSFTEDVLGVSKDDIRLSCMWANAHNNGGKHSIHQHPNSFLSGVIYLQCPPCEDIGNLNFIDPRQAKNMMHPDFIKDSAISNRSIWVKPKKGMMVLFPSWLEHGTEEYTNNENDDQRISMSFNFVLNKAKSKTMKF